MGSLGMLNIAAPPPPPKKKIYFGTVQDQQKKDFFTAGASVYGPLLEIQAISYSCAKHLTRLAGYSLVDRRQFLCGSQVI